MMTNNNNITLYENHTIHSTNSDCRRRWYHKTTTTSSSSLSSSSVVVVDTEKEKKVKLTTIRLYRILQRLCRDFNNDMTIPTTTTTTKIHESATQDKSTEEEQLYQQHQEHEQERRILLQPNLEAPDWGRHSTYMAARTTHVEQLFRLFYVWNDNDDHDGSNDVVIYNTGSSGGDDTTSSSSYSYTTSIDDWYSELIRRRRRNNNSMDEENDNDADEDPLLSSSIPPMTSMTCWTTSKQLREAVRIAFKTLGGTATPDNDDDSVSSSSLPSLPPSTLHKWAIRAVQTLQEQRDLWAHSSTAITDGIVRITATSRCIGTTSPVPSSIPPPIPTTSQRMVDATPKYRFAYRIRVENISSSTSSDSGDDDDNNKNNNAMAVQLMGRYWHISEQSVGGDDLATALSTPIIVNAPVTGAVGQLPVLLPGQVFEYMSGTDLATPKGIMKGHLYMARVPSNTRSGKSGDDIDALKKKQLSSLSSTTATTGESNSNNNSNSGTKGKEEQGEDEVVGTTHFFEAKVAPFPLDASRRI